VVTFAPRTITWVRFTVDAVRPGTQHAGLGELQVYASDRAVETDADD